jgi:hypothetical protein
MVGLYTASLPFRRGARGGAPAPVRVRWLWYLPEGDPEGNTAGHYSALARDALEGYVQRQADDLDRWRAEEDAAKQLAYQFELDLAINRLELKAGQIRRELGDAEIDRRVKAIHARWRHEDDLLAEYWREVKAARHRRDRPPHPVHNHAAWQE